MTLNEVFDKYLIYYEFLLRPSTLKSDIATYNKHIKQGLGLNCINEIVFLDIQSFCNNLIRSGYKIKTVKNILTKLKVVFKFAIKLELITKNPCDFVELPRFDNKIYFNYSVKTQKNIIKAIVNNTAPTSDIFYFLLHGRRKNEVLSLKWSDINLKNKTYSIPFQINKAKRTMIYLMSDGLYHRLYKRYVALIKAGLYCADSYVFINPATNNKYVDLRKSWYRLLKTNNLPKLRLHDIRHLIATYSINYLGSSVELVSYCLGHTNIATTQRYITKDMKMSLDVIENMLKSVK